MEKVCRACREHSDSLVNIFNNQFPQLHDEPNLAEMLSELAACEVRRDDPLPQQMCIPCVNAAQNAFRFKRKCEQSHQHFWDMLSGKQQNIFNELFETDNMKQPDGWPQNRLEPPLNPSERHCQTAPAADENSHICPTCGKGFATNRKLVLHQSFHGPQQGSNNNNNNSNNGQSGERIFKCPHCEKIFNGNWWLQRHVRTHTGERPYKCSHCEKAFKDSWGLRRHIRTHVGVCQYKCLYCPKTFSNARSQRIHICTHTGDHPYKCNQCQATYAQSGSLKRHMRVHTSETSFKCPHCPMVFAMNYNLKRHMSTHIT